MSVCELFEYEGRGSGLAIKMVGMAHPTKGWFFRNVHGSITQEQGVAEQALPPRGCLAEDHEGAYHGHGGTPSGCGESETSPHSAKEFLLFLTRGVALNPYRS